MWSVESRESISIHALREEGDAPTSVCAVWPKISIHALREEGDQHRAGGHRPVREFLSTPSARRATVDGPISVQLVEFLSTPSARRATQRGSRRSSRHEISIHALREEGDWISQNEDWLQEYFYPRPPRGGRPSNSPDASTIEYISIHALREEGDTKTTLRTNPRSEFLSTPSARRATF